MDLFTRWYFPMSVLLFLALIFFCIIVPDTQRNAFMNENWSHLFNEVSSSLFSVWSQITFKIFSGFEERMPFVEVFPKHLPKWLDQYISNSKKSCHCIRLICINQQSQTARKQKPMFEILEICDCPWKWVRIISDSTGNLICLLYLELLQQVVVWWHVVSACCNQ